jgi:hypothetical protein
MRGTSCGLSVLGQREEPCVRSGRASDAFRRPDAASSSNSRSTNRSSFAAFGSYQLGREIARAYACVL